MLVLLGGLVVARLELADTLVVLALDIGYTLVVRRIVERLCLGGAVDFRVELDVGVQGVLQLVRAVDVLLLDVLEIVGDVQLCLLYTSRHARGGCRGPWGRRPA